MVLILLANGPAAIAVASVYAVSLTAVFGSSAVYHRGQWTERARRWMKRVDHSMIYVLIAASYTPVAALVLGGTWEVVLLSVIWAGAVVGVTMKMARPDGLSIVSAALYMVLGWLAILALPQLVREMTTAELDPPARGRACSTRSGRSCSRPAGPIPRRRPSATTRCGTRSWWPPRRATTR